MNESTVQTLAQAVIALRVKLLVADWKARRSFYAQIARESGNPETVGLWSLVESVFADALPGVRVSDYLDAHPGAADALTGHADVGVSPDVFTLAESVVMA